MKALRRMVAILGALLPAFGGLAIGNAAFAETTVVTNASPPLLIGITLDRVGYRRPGSVVLGATVSCTRPASGQWSATFQLHGQVAHKTGLAPCGKTGATHVVLLVPGPWGSGPAKVNASFKAGGQTATTARVVIIT